jgi:hypothetical protein
MQAKKLAAQVAELRASPDNKRCWDCEQLVSGICNFTGPAFTNTSSFI